MSAASLRRKLCAWCVERFETPDRAQHYCSAACEARKPRHFEVGDVVGAGWVVMEVITEPIKGTQRRLYRTRCPACGGSENLRPARHLNTVPHCRGCANRARPKKTECVNGHPYDEANTRYLRRGGRECRQCHVELLRRKRRARGCRESKRRSQP